MLPELIPITPKSLSQWTSLEAFGLSVEFYLSDNLPLGCLLFSLPLALIIKQIPDFLYCSGQSLTIPCAHILRRLLHRFLCRLSFLLTLTPHLACSLGSLEVCKLNSCSSSQAQPSFSIPYFNEWIHHQTRCKSQRFCSHSCHFPLLHLLYPICHPEVPVFPPQDNRRNKWIHFSLLPHHHPSPHYWYFSCEHCNSLTTLPEFTLLSTNPSSILSQRNSLPRKIQPCHFRT